MELCYSILDPRDSILLYNYVIRPRITFPGPWSRIQFPRSRPKSKPVFNLKTREVLPAEIIILNQSESLSWSEPTISLVAVTQQYKRELILALNLTRWWAWPWNLLLVINIVTVLVNHVIPRFTTLKHCSSLNHQSTWKAFFNAGLLPLG